MTNDFKENILNYVTNNITPTSKSDEQILERIQSFAKSKYSSYLPNGNNGLQINGVIKSITNGNMILYGEYIVYGGTAENDSRGIILILDNNFNPITSIYQFSTGTYLRPIQKLIQIEDGTFVGVDSTIYASKDQRAKIQSNIKRFIMLNNISVPITTNIYRVVLRTSYILPNPNFFCIDMIKNPNSSHYLMAGATYLDKGSGLHFDGLRVIDLKVNVGAENEWLDYTTPNNRYYVYGGFYGEFNKDDIASWKIITTYNEVGLESLKSWDGTNYITLMTNDNINPYVDSLAMDNQVQFINKNIAYFVVNNQRWGASVIPRYIGLYKYDFSTGGLKNIYFKTIGNYDYNESKEGIFLTVNNGELYVNYNDNYNYANKTANFNYQRLTDDLWSPILIAENKKYVMENQLTFTGSMYNLITNLSFNLSLHTNYWNFIVINEIYNSANYNSTSYDDYNSTVPRSATLYGNNGIMFARNLYDITSLNSTTTSTVQVPNTLLNDETIKQENLISETNSSLVSNNQDIDKNIYETLYINFINTINVKDEDTNVVYPNAATYVNSNINIGTKQNCDMSYVGKVAINYTNNTIIQHLTWVYDTDHYVTSFTVDCTNEIPTIDFMSNDESTIYISKELDVSVGSYYVIEQKIRIE